jgi:hypothetical protein
MEVEDRASGLGILVFDVVSANEDEPESAYVEMAIIFGLVRGQRGAVPGAEPVRVGAGEQNAANAAKRGRCHGCPSWPHLIAARHRFPPRECSLLTTEHRSIGTCITQVTPIALWASSVT